MKTIGDLLSRDLSRKIEEIIQVDQADEQSVYAEITEYVATDSIRDQYCQLLKAIAEAPSDPNEGIGVWVSGFFGSGKSSFAKNLGYALQNHTVLGEHFADLFKRAARRQASQRPSRPHQRPIPTEVILFEVAKERDTRKVTRADRRVDVHGPAPGTGLRRGLRHRRTGDRTGSRRQARRIHRDLQEAPQAGLEDGPQGCPEAVPGQRRPARTSTRRPTPRPIRGHTPSGTGMPRSPSARSWNGLSSLLARRRPGKALVFIIDEVGQHVARSGDKIEDLRATVEEFGKVGKNLLKARKIIAPCWIIVTSQEKLDEVVAAIDSKRVELAKLQDRFRHRVDLAPSDIREVATKRVLAKKPEADPDPEEAFRREPGAAERRPAAGTDDPPTEITEADFVQFYPYPPHYIDLCIGIMSGIRLQPGAPRHYGGSNRTIIKQAYEMLVSDRTAMATKPIGTLVTLDKVYELVEGNLSSEKRTDIHEIGQRFKDDPEDHGWALAGRQGHLPPGVHP